MAPFPNPSSSTFNLKGLKPGTNIEVFDVNGKLIYKNCASSDTFIIDLSGKQKGNYLLKLTGGHGIVKCTTLILEY